MYVSRKYKIFFIIAPLVFILDQITKRAILSNILYGKKIPVINGFFDIVHFRNTGAAFGMFSGVSDSIREPFFYIVAIIASLVLIWFLRSLRDDRILLPAALSLVFGGMLGNVLDRIRLGSVVDFLSFHIGNKILDFEFLTKQYNIELEWPAFNVADSAITIAMFLLIYSVLFLKDE